MKKARQDDMLIPAGFLASWRRNQLIAKDLFVLAGCFGGIVIVLDFCHYSIEQKHYNRIANYKYPSHH